MIKVFQDESLQIDVGDLIHIDSLFGLVVTDIEVINLSSSSSTSGYSSILLLKKIKLIFIMLDHEKAITKDSSYLRAYDEYFRTQVGGFIEGYFTCELGYIPLIEVKKSNIASGVGRLAFHRLQPISYLSEIVISSVIAS